jgi:cytochrome c oxidase subunit 2
MRVSHLTWFMLAVAAAVYVVTLAATAFAISRNRQRASREVDLAQRSERWIIIGGVVLPALILTITFVESLRAMGHNNGAEPAFTVRVVGHQWWWELQYHPGSSQMFATANELHIPAGKSVRLLLTSADVIHSFWVPELQGKLDVNPGDTNDLRLQSRTVGEFRGKCAEFCGTQHANMGFTVVAEDSVSFAVWEARQIQQAAVESDSIVARGHNLFMTAGCATCHTVRGFTSTGNFAPDLTHVASRAKIGAGVLAMQPGNLEGWIANAPAIKAGVHMPVTNTLAGDELRALAAYIASLK